MTIFSTAGNMAASALATALYSTGKTDKYVGKLTARMLAKMLFSQGWQWAIEIDGLPGGDFFVRDITYSRYSVESQPLKIGGGEINVPTGRLTTPLTMTIRDSVDGLAQRWFDGAIDMVANVDGTVNLPSDYAFNIRIYRLLVSGLSLLETELTVYPTQRGDVTLTRDSVSQFHTYPLTFTVLSTFGDTNSSSLLDSALSFSL